MGTLIGSTPVALVKKERIDEVMLFNFQAEIGKLVSENESLQTQLAESQAEVERLKSLLKVSKCRDCNDTGIIRTRVYGDVDINPCRWCQEKSTALDAAKGEKGVDNAVSEV